VPLGTLENWLKKARWTRGAARAADSDDPAVLKARIRELEKSLERAQMERTF